MPAHDMIALGWGHSFSIAGMELLLVFWFLLKRWGWSKKILVVCGFTFLVAATAANICLILGLFDFFQGSVIAARSLLAFHLILALFFARQGFNAFGGYRTDMNADNIGVITPISSVLNLEKNPGIPGVLLTSLIVGFVVTMTGWIWPRDIEVFMSLRMQSEVITESMPWSMLGIYSFVFLWPLIFTWVVLSIFNDFPRLREGASRWGKLILMGYSAAMFAVALGIIILSIKEILTS